MEALADVLGLLGAFCLSLCALPQALLVVRAGNAKGLSSGMLWLWFVGEVCFFAYVPLKIGWDLPLLLNYVFNLACLVVLLRYKLWPRKPS